MEFTLRQLYCCWLYSKDQLLGAVRDLLFDTADWHVRYLVVETGTWPSPRRVLLDALDISSVDTPAKRVLTTLSQAQLNDCPLEAAHPSASQQFAIECSGPPSVPVHWADTPPIITTIECDPNLESATELVGYTVVPAVFLGEHVSDVVVVGQAGVFKITFALVNGYWGWGTKRQVSVTDTAQIDIEQRRLLLGEIRSSNEK